LAQQFLASPLFPLHQRYCHHRGLINNANLGKYWVFAPKQLAEPLEFSSKIRPICLSKKGVPEPQKNAIISGWGHYNCKKNNKNIMVQKIW
jgi:hypothetical protein